jgi:protein O-GlcNAc transferase
VAGSKSRANIDKQLAKALADHQAGNLVMAEAGYLSILEKVPDNPDALHLRGVIKMQTGDFPAAIGLIEKAIEKHPYHCDFYINLGNALAHHGQIDAAIGVYQQGLELNPHHVDGHHNLGNLFKRAQRFLEAVQAFQHALALQPQRAEAHNDLGNVFIELGQIGDAIASFNQAIALKPDFAVAMNNLGTAFKVLERYPDAIKCYQQAAAINERYAEALNNLGATFEAMGNPDAAIQYFRKALAIRPDLALARVDLYYALKRTCAWSQMSALEEELDTDTARAIENGTRLAEDPFLSLARHADPVRNAAVAKFWSDAIEVSASRLETGFSFEGRNIADSKITIGYLSENFRNHAMAHLMAGLFEHHDRSRYNIFAYSTGKEDRSDIRNRIENGCDRFVDIRSCSHLDSAQIIYTDKVDILVDLMGYTRGGRMEIAALRPAPVQVRYMGMAGTTGSDFFDYLIADQTVIPPADAQHYSEQLVYMPDCYQVNDGRQADAGTTFNRTELGLPSDGVLFCSFNQLFKLDPVLFEVWMKILQQVPGSVLWLQSGPPSAETNLRMAASNCGISVERLVFGPKMVRSQHLVRLKLADIALDTRLVNGAATTSDALWAGLPVVSLKGGHFSSRMSTSILRAIGLSELVASDLDAYLQLAVKLGQKPEFLESMRQRLDVNRRTRKLFDTANMTRNLETAYAIMWKNYCRGDSPAQIDVGEYHCLPELDAVAEEAY